MSASNITEDFKKIGFGTFDVNKVHPRALETAKEAFKKSMEYYKRFDEIKSLRSNSIALLGQSGAGKTHLLIAISNNLLRKSVEVLYFPYKEGFDDLKKNFDELERKINRMQNAQVLFIDDLFKGRTQVTDFQIETMFGVINYRYLNHLPILVSSEKTFDMMIDIDEAIASRLYEMSKDFKVIYKGKELNYRFKDMYMG